MTLLPDGTWVGDISQAPRGCSLGNESAFLRCTATADLDGIWLAENSRWYTGELSVTPLPASDWEVSEVFYAPNEQGVVYQRADGARITKKITLDAKAPTVHIKIESSYLPRDSAVKYEVRWRVGAALSDAHRQQPYGHIERRWKLAEVSGGQISVRSMDAEEESLEITSWNKLDKAEWLEPNLFTAECTLDENEGGVSLYLRPYDVVDFQAEDAYQHLNPPLISLPNLPPESLIPAAHKWGRVCSWRVFHKYGTGDWGFTNDPPGNTIVTRDCAWYIFGADYFAPELSSKLLDTLKRHCIYPSGKVAEYVRLETGNVTIDDYGLNINDATPLFLLGLAHHHRRMSERGQPYPLEAIQADFALARRCADWILQQRNANGLVWCDGKGTNVWGIGGWRNIIPAYRLAGELTELNALCVAALRAVAGLATSAGDFAAATRYTASAEALSEAMAQLVNPATGMFYLNRDENGANPQIAIDCALPALFNAGPEEAQRNTLLRLIEPDFRCPQGILTLSRNDKAFHPRYGWGLMGGSWYNATAWVAVALARYDAPAAWELAEQLASSLFPQEKRSHGVGVPGQFAEWYDPERNESAGMSLSPWMPATFVWLIEEGIPFGGVRS
ncbi:MAG: hypothetical protein NT023_10140 [Armatimonadetes bacterium]|nr:hypothetical protein [Armatimonadota bacterium]